MAKSAKRTKAIAYLRTSSAANVGADKDSDKRQADAIASFADRRRFEVGVQIAQRWILAALRNRRFFSLGELNTAIRGLVDKLNRRMSRHQKLGNNTTANAVVTCVRLRSLQPDRNRHIFADCSTGNSA